MFLCTSVPKIIQVLSQLSGLLTFAIGYGQLPPPARAHVLSLMNKPNTAVP